MKFEQRTAVITGAAGRIGQAVAREFAKHNVRLYLADINMERLNGFVSLLRSEGADAFGVQMDVSDPENIRKAAAAILADAGKVDILVNNAGVWPAGTVQETDDDKWVNTINLNLHSVFRLSKVFAADMIKNKYGRIVNLASIAGLVGLPGYSAYSAAKAAVLMLTKTMAMELAKDGITVNSVSPGLIEDKVRSTGGTWLGHTGLGEDVARAIVYLASDDSGYITGIDVPVDGGRVLGPHNG